MATATVTITNISKQIIPILVNSITTSSVNSSSTIDSTVASQMSIPPSSQVIIERQRISLAQLDQLRKKSLITYTTS
jgi:uncharacterized lipoprotein YbaY